MKKASLIFLGLSLLWLSSCTDDALLNDTQEVKNGQWLFDDAKQFELVVDDTLTPYHFSFQIRHGGNYNYQNLILLLKTYQPDNSFTSDTFNCPLANPAGKWYGSGLGDILDLSVMFQRNVQFDQSGNYRFEIQHVMRPDTIFDVFDIGLLVSPAAQ